MREKMNRWTLPFGATVLGDNTIAFGVWAPFVEAVEVKTAGPGKVITVPMKRKERGCFETIIEKVPPGTRYFYRLNGKAERPDPYSRFQPEGVHGPSEVIDPDFFKWTATEWKGLPLEEYIIYELHPGTFTREGTFESILPRLDYLKNELGVTAIEIMPVAQFPGTRNWGYDGVHLFAPQQSYGGPLGLKRLIDGCHQIGLAVILDVVYNHFGPEGNYLSEFGPYFTEKYRTPWGSAINYDDSGSDFVRQYVIDNALYWITEYHVDALRLDAVHAIFDFSAKHILRQLKEEVEEAAKSLGRSAYLIGESDLNDPKVIESPQKGGYGLDAQWSDDFHHSLHVLLTRERNGYYEDFGRLDQLSRAITNGFVIAGDYSPYRDRIHGARCEGYPYSKFVVCTQNHDQIGNRILGDRLSTLIPFEAQKLAAAALLLSPNLPLLFMGEEYGETAPFLYFSDFQDRELAEAVQRGRKEEAAAFGWSGTVPNPQAEETFLQSKINPALRSKDPHTGLFSFYQRLIAARKCEPGFKEGKVSVESFEDKKCLIVKLLPDTHWMIFNFNSESISLSIHFPKGKWERILDSQEKPFGGNEDFLLPSLVDGDKKQMLWLTPYQVTLYRRLE
jgi:maltooligosyltrehalose trehalohydrolase